MTNDLSPCHVGEPDDGTGDDGTGGAQPAAPSDSPSKGGALTVLRNMATTGDPFTAAALSLTAAALLAGGAALAARRRRTR